MCKAHICVSISCHLECFHNYCTFSLTRVRLRPPPRHAKCCLPLPGDCQHLFLLCQGSRNRGSLKERRVVGLNITIILACHSFLLHTTSSIPSSSFCSLRRSGNGSQWMGIGGHVFSVCCLTRLPQSTTWMGRLDLYLQKYYIHTTGGTRYNFGQCCLFGLIMGISTTLGVDRGQQPWDHLYLLPLKRDFQE